MDSRSPKGDVCQLRLLRASLRTRCRNAFVNGGCIEGTHRAMPRTPHERAKGRTRPPSLPQPGTVRGAGGSRQGSRTRRIARFAATWRCPRRTGKEEIMKYEIKHRFTGKVLFSLETDSLKLCVEGAVKSKANLGGAYLRDANLGDANLVGANLRGAYLVDANLRGANLVDANLRGANLRGANIVGAIFGGAYLVDANLDGANLVDANLGGAYLRGAYLVDANLRDANLRDAYLVDANLRDANLGGANLRGANLGGANLRGANL